MPKEMEQDREEWDLREEEVPDAVDQQILAGLHVAPGWGAEERDRAWNQCALNAEQKQPASAVFLATSRNARNAEAPW